MEVFERGDTTSGVYSLSGSNGTFDAYCDMSIAGEAGWTVIQNRQSGDIEFNRTWQDYVDGFGSTSGNYWLGLRNIRDIVSLTGSTFELYIDMQSFHPTDVNRFARYKSFSIGGEETNYVLRIGMLDQRSTAGDSLSYHNNQQFSTPDRDNDSAPRTHCAKVFRAGWWFNNCHDSLLNGRWYAGGLLAQLDLPDGIIWETWAGDRESLKTTVMAVRPVT